MKRQLLLSLLLLAITAPAMAQSAKPVLYLVPGTGGDERLFSYIELDSWELVPLPMPVPPKGASMADMAAQLLPLVDTTRLFALGGVSLGGMVAVEMAKQCQPATVLLISSAKARQELPVRYRWFLRHVPVYRLISGERYKSMTNWARPLFEPEARPWDALFAQMVNAKDPDFIPRALDAIMRWDNREAPPFTYHLHGTKDSTLPSRYIRDADKLKGASHMIVVTRADTVSQWLNARLQEAEARAAQ